MGSVDIGPPQRHHASQGVFFFVVKLVDEFGFAASSFQQIVLRNHHRSDAHVVAAVPATEEMMGLPAPTPATALTQPLHRSTSKDNNSKQKSLCWMENALFHHFSRESKRGFWFIRGQGEEPFFLKRYSNKIQQESCDAKMLS